MLLVGAWRFAANAETSDGRLHSAQVYTCRVDGDGQPVETERLVNFHFSDLAH